MNSYPVTLRKDLRRFAVLIGLWVALLAATFYFTVAPIPVQVADHLSALWEFWKFVASLLYWLVTIFLAAGVILEDSPRGTDGFWLTRPFERRAVLEAKFTVLGALILVPIGLTAIAMASLGAGAGEIAITALSSLVGTGMIPVAAAVIAATAESLGKFALTAILLVIGCVLISGIFTVSMTLHRLGAQGMAHFTPSNPTLPASANLVSQLTLLIVSSALLAWRYLQPHIRFFLGYVILAALICLQIPIFWRWDFLHNTAAGHPAQPAIVSDVRFSMTVAPNQNIGARPQLVGAIAAVASDPGKAILPRRLSDASFSWPNGERIKIVESSPAPRPAIFRQVGEVSSSMFEQNAPELVAQAVAPETVVNLPQKQLAQFPLFPMGGVWQAELFKAAPEVVGFVSADVVQREAAGELPLEIGARARIAGRVITVLGRSGEHSGEERLTVRTGWLSSPLANAFRRNHEVPFTPATTSLPSGAPFYWTAVYLLVNHSRHQAIMGKLTTPFAGRARDIGGYSMETSLLTFEHPLLDAAWTQDAVLTCVVYGRVGTATGTVVSSPVDLSH